MKILVDAHMLGKRETGNETYILNLLDGLAGVKDVSCAAAVTPGAPIPERLRKADITLLTLPSVSNWARLFRTLPTLCREWGADVLHCTYLGPWFAPCPLVLSVHDVVFKRYPGFFSPRDRVLFSTLFPLSLRRAATIVTISEHSKREIEHFFPYTRGKTVVTPLAADRHFRPVEKELLRGTRARFNLQSRFILTVGNLQPRKNLLRVIQAFAKVRERVSDVRLVVIGKAQWKSSDVYRQVEALGLTDEVVFTGYVPLEDLVAFYNLAEVYVYPSLYEGFGLPVLEAMQCGTPVVTSKSTSIPEVAGDAALLVDPLRVDEIAAAMLAVLTDPAAAAALRARGIEQARKFSWETTAERTAEIYRTLARER